MRTLMEAEAGAVRSGRSVLLVDDNEDDRELTTLALLAVSPGLVVHEVVDGLDALDWLRTAANPPALVLLDLNMPRLDGAGVLLARLNEPALRTIPVAVFSTSNTPRDVRRCYELGANLYLTKPNGVGAAELVLGDVLRVFLAHAETAAA